MTGRTYYDLLNDLSAGRLTRRDVIRKGLATGLSLPVIAALLAACGGSSGSEADASANTPSSSGGDAPTQAPAEEAKRVSIHMWPSWEDHVLREGLPWMEEELGLEEIFYEPGFSLDAVAKLRANRAKPPYLLAGMDFNVVPIAKADDLLDPIDEELVPNLADVYPEFIYADGYGVGLGSKAMGLSYNPEITDPPESWADLWLPDFRDSITPPDFKLTNGVAFFVMAGAVKLGATPQEAQYEPDACFEAMKELKPNIKSYWSTTAQEVQLVHEGSIKILAMSNTDFTYEAQDQGLSIDFITPKEGAFALVNCGVIVKNSAAPETAQRLLNLLLSPRFQEGIAAGLYLGPVNRQVKLSEKDAARVPSTPEQVSALHNLDWEWITSQRDEWTERWNREILG